MSRPAAPPPVVARRAARRLLALAAAFSWSAVAPAQDDAPRRTRVALGPQLVPSYPGADTVSVRPLIDFSRARGDTPFTFEAADESAGFALLRRGGMAIGPAIGFEGSRTRGDVGAPVDKVGFTVEAGAFIQYQLSETIRLRAELRKGIGGHEGWVGSLGGDYVMRSGDAWLVAFGPRLTLADDRYHRAYFGVSAEDAAATGSRRFRADGGVQAVGVTTNVLRQLTPRWGVYAYARYDRLAADAGRSPLAREYGSRNQLSGGVAATYTFGVR